MAQERYNGWANHDTWCVALWIDNDQGLYAQSTEILDDCRRNGFSVEQARNAYMDWLEDLVSECTAEAEDALSGCSDLTMDLFRPDPDVDWFEIADSALQEYGYSPVRSNNRKPLSKKRYGSKAPVKALVKKKGKR